MPRHSRPFRSFDEIWGWPRWLPSPWFLSGAGGSTFPPLRLEPESWRTIRDILGRPQHGIPAAAFRADIEELLGQYAAWAPRGRERLDRKRVARRARAIARAARALRAALTSGRSWIAEAEQRFLRRELERTGSGSLVAWDALEAVSYTHLTLPTIYSV